MNIQNHDWSVPLEEIQAAEACMNAWVIPNGLRIITANGAVKFVVEGRHSWMEQILQAKGIRA